MTYCNYDIDHLTALDCPIYKSSGGLNTMSYSIAYSVQINFSGVRTGRCVQSDRDPHINVCQIYGWCPTEIDVLPMPNNNFRYPIYIVWNRFSLIVHELFYKY